MIPNTAEHRSVLESLSLKQELLMDVGLKILTAYRSTTENDAKTAAGSQAYYAAVRSVREELRPYGWEKRCDAHIELVFNKALNVQIMVSSGDKNTGNERGQQPKTRNPKGGETEIIVKQNNELYLFPDWEPQKENHDTEKVPTWVLLHHVDNKLGEIRMELSFPDGIDSNSQKIGKWKKRILLPALKFEPTPDDFTPDFGPEVEFDIEWKK